MRTLLLTVFILASTFTFSQKKEFTEGVYTMNEGETSWILILVDGYASMTQYKNDEFLSTLGGTYSYKNNALSINKDYSTDGFELGGPTAVIPFFAAKEGFEGTVGNLWTKTDTSAQDLDGVWEISGRMVDEKLVKIDHKGGRHTYKILKDGYFQWIAFDNEKKEFYATGGGYYTLEKGKYTEKIVFFSKDSSRVGAELSFDAETDGTDWLHSGKSSKGDPIYEIWSRVGF